MYIISKLASYIVQNRMTRPVYVDIACIGANPGGGEEGLPAEERLPAEQAGQAHHPWLHRHGLRDLGQGK